MANKNLEEMAALIRRAGHESAEIVNEAIELGRVSVLREFDAMCAADAFIGFTTEEWAAIKKFFAFNKQISGWNDESKK